MSMINVRVDGHVGTIMMVHDAKRNALSAPLITDLIDAFRRLGEKRTRAIILRAQPGARVWSAGHDVRELPASRRDPLGWDDPLRTLIRTVETHPAPVISLVEGGVWGGACELVFATDIVIASPSATFAITPARLGVPYNISGILNFLNAASRTVLREMVFTAAPMSAARAERLGIINHVVEQDELERFSQDMALQIAANSPLSIAVMKEELRILESAHSMTPRMFERIQGLRRTVYDSDDYREGLSAFLEKRRPDFQGT